MVTQGLTGTSNSSPWIPMTVAACGPSTASQRRRNRVASSAYPRGRARAAAIEAARAVDHDRTAPGVDDVPFRSARGSITGLLGGNGAGKTATIARIMGLVRPTSGLIQGLGCARPAQSAEVLGR